MNFNISFPEDPNGSTECDSRDRVEVGDRDQVPHDGCRIAEVVGEQQPLVNTDHDEHGKTFFE